MVFSPIVAGLRRPFELVGESIAGILIRVFDHIEIARISVRGFFDKFLRQFQSLARIRARYSYAD
jgi:hypothetical protein